MKLECDLMDGVKI